MHGTVTDGDFDLEADVTLDNIVAEISAHMSADGNVMAPNLETGVDVFIKGMFFTFGFFSDYDGASRTIDGSIFVAGDVVGWMVGSPEEGMTAEPAGTGELNADGLTGLLVMFEAVDRMFDGSLGIIGLTFAVVGAAIL